MPRLIGSTITPTDALTTDYTSSPLPAVLQQKHFLIDSTDVLYYINPFTCDLTRPGCRDSGGYGFIGTDTYILTADLAGNGYPSS